MDAEVGSILEGKGSHRLQEPSLEQNSSRVVGAEAGEEDCHKLQARSLSGVVFMYLHLDSPQPACR